MSDSFDFPQADVFWPGADGTPGQRVFFLAGGVGDEMVYLRCEKQQVAALGEYLLALLEDLSPEVEPASDLGEVTPLPFRWDVGEIGVASTSPATASSSCSRSWRPTTRSRPPPASASPGPRQRPSPTSRSALVAGRPDCRFCGLPVDPRAMRARG